MNVGRKLLMIATATAGLASVVACSNGQGQAGVVPAPSVQTVTVAAPQRAQNQPTDAPVQEQPQQQPEQQPQPEQQAQPPVLQRTQRAVQIFSGSSPTPIQPRPADVGKSRPAVQLTAGRSVLTDDRGMTLYRFDLDSANPPKATCVDDCAKKWPPLLIKSPGKIYLDGVDPSRIGYVERPDGTCQVTVGGWPAYYFFKDQKPGDILGQGVGGTWFALDAQGGKAKVANTGGGSGY